MKISLLSPVHNEARHIQDMISSLVAQTHKNWEVIFVDDGSTDETADLIRKAERAERRVRLVASGVKIGKVPAFNMAYTASEGDIVAVMGGDDIFPEDALSCRVAAFRGKNINEPTIAFFKLRTFSEDPRFDGMTLPRGNATSRSGGSSTLNRALADIVFPMNEDLVAEDIWLAYAGMGQAVNVVECRDVVLNYRIHSGNSTPRHKPFRAMSAAIHQRNLACRELLNATHISLRPEIKREVEAMWHAEQLRLSGKILRILCSKHLSIADRLAMVALSNSALYGVRSRFYKLFSGWRGK